DVDPPVHEEARLHVQVRVVGVNGRPPGGAVPTVERAGGGELTAPLLQGALVPRDVLLVRVGEGALAGDEEVVQQRSAEDRRVEAASMIHRLLEVSGCFVEVVELPRKVHGKRGLVVDEPGEQGAARRGSDPVGEVLLLSGGEREGDAVQPAVWWRREVGVETVVGQELARLAFFGTCRALRKMANVRRTAEVRRE